MRLPVALHATHGAAVTIWPRIERRTSRTSPAPPHTSQRAGCVPGSQPEPSQRSHATGRRTSTVAVAPNAACGELEVHHRLGVGRARRAGLTVAEGVAAEERVEDVAEAEGLAAAPDRRRHRARAVFAEDVVATTALGIRSVSYATLISLNCASASGSRVVVGVVAGAPARGTRA